MKEDVNILSRKNSENLPIVWMILIFMCVVLGIWAFLDYQKSVADDIVHRETQQKLEKELLEKTSCIHYVDSLKRINNELSKFESLTMAMVHRSDATNELKHKVGDIAYLKVDSSRIVIEDIIIGGGKFNYFIKYKIVFKDYTNKEVTPEMIY